MELTKIYFFVLTVLTNLSLDTLAQDTFSDYSSSTDSSSDSATLEPSTTPAGAAAAITTHQPKLTTPMKAHEEDAAFTTSPTNDYGNLTIYDKALLRTTETSWELEEPSLRFGLPTNQRRRRGRPKCCRRVRENEKGQGKKMNCRGGSIFSRDARGRRRRKCRRRNRCKTRCKQHYKNTAWSIVGTMMKGLDFFIPKLEFKFHTGTLVFGTKFFSGLVPFIQAKMQAMHFFYSLFEPLLDGVLDALDFGRIGFRSLDLDADDDDDDDEDDEDDKRKEVLSAQENAVIVDEKYDAEKLDDYDDSDIVPDIMLAKNDDLHSLPGDEEDADDDEGYDSPKEDEPVDEDYGIDEDWDSDDDDDDDDNIVEDDEEEDGEEVALKPPKKIIKRPLKVQPKPTRKEGVLSLFPPPKRQGDHQMIQDFMNRVKGGESNYTIYHSKSNIAGSHNKDKHGKPLFNPSALNETQVLNVDNLVLNINSKPAAAATGTGTHEYEDEVEYQDDVTEELDDDKLIESAKPYNRVKARPPVFSSFGAFFGAISEAFDAYFSGTY